MRSGIRIVGVDVFGNRPSRHEVGRRFVVGGDDVCPDRVGVVVGSAVGRSTRAMLGTGVGATMPVRMGVAAGDRLVITAGDGPVITAGNRPAVRAGVRIAFGSSAGTIISFVRARAVAGRILVAHPGHRPTPRIATSRQRLPGCVEYCSDVLYWLLKRVILGPVLRLLFRPWAEGVENVPETGAAILASNHLSFSDSVFLPLAVRRRVTFLAKSDYFTGPGIRGWLTKNFFRGIGQVPIDRSGGRASEGALRTSMRVLRRGDLLGIYPEGTRSPDGRLYRGKTGVARIALEAGVPVIPVAMIDTEKIQPPGQVIPKIGRVGIRFGKPLDFSRYAGMSTDRFVLRSVTDEIMYELMELSGQEYVDVYAQKMKAEIAAARRRGAADAAKLPG